MNIIALTHSLAKRDLDHARAINLYANIEEDCLGSKLAEKEGE